MQGQLHVTQKKQCIFAVWSSDKEPLRTEIIAKDDLFWNSKMKCKLERFYIECMLPEIVDPRFTRNMPIREPATNKSTDETTHTDDANNTLNVVDDTNDVLIQDIKEQSDTDEPTCRRYLSFTDL